MYYLIVYQYPGGIWQCMHVDSGDEELDPEQMAYSITDAAQQMNARGDTKVKIYRLNEKINDAEINEINGELRPAAYAYMNDNDLLFNETITV